MVNKHKFIDRIRDTYSAKLCMYFITHLNIPIDVTKKIII